MFILKISYWDLVTNKYLSMFTDVHPPGFGVLNVKVSRKMEFVSVLIILLVQFTDDPNCVLFSNTGGHVFEIKLK